MINEKKSGGFSVFNIVLWLLVIILFASLITSVHYTFRDDDSNLYSKIAQELTEKPLNSWIAPRWINYSGQDAYFREHPSGLFWVSAALIRLGAPKEQSAAIANFLYFLLTLLFVFKLGEYFKDKVMGWAMTWSVFLIPVSLKYLVRGNLEPPLTLAIVMGIYCLCRAQETWRYRIGFALALILAVFFKGMQGAFLGIAGGLYWLMVERDKTRFFTLVTSALALFSVMVFYEWLYQAQTGEQFWMEYLSIQVGASVAHNSIWHKPYNLIWYLARAAFFTLPWSIFLLLGLRNAKVRDQFPSDKRWRWIIVSAAILIVIMSCFDRCADRYIFPSYILIAMAGGWYLYERFPIVKNSLNTDSKKLQITLAVALLTAVVLKIYSSIYLHKNIQIWQY